MFSTETDGKRQTRRYTRATGKTRKGRLPPSVVGGRPFTRELFVGRLKTAAAKKHQSDLIVPLGRTV